MINESKCCILVSNKLLDRFRICLLFWSSVGSSTIPPVGRGQSTTQQRQRWASSCTHYCCLNLDDARTRYLLRTEPGRTPPCRHWPPSPARRLVTVGCSSRRPRALSCGVGGATWQLPLPVVVVLLVRRFSPGERTPLLRHAHRAYAPMRARVAHDVLLAGVQSETLACSREL